MYVSCTSIIPPCTSIIPHHGTLLLSLNDIGPANTAPLEPRNLLQGLPDHAHKPTLEVLPRDMHVVANNAAAKVCQTGTGAAACHTNLHIWRLTLSVTQASAAAQRHDDGDLDSCPHGRHLAVDDVRSDFSLDGNVD